MEFIDYYKVLGIDKSATQAQIKSAYKKLARKLHPDLNPDDKDANAKFQQLNEANAVLNDPEKRAKYDKYGKDWERGEEYEQYQQAQQQQSRSRGGNSGAGGFGGFEGNFSGGGEDFSDFFSSMFGRQSGQSGSRSRAQYKGQDYNSEVSLTLDEAYTTHKQTFSVNGKTIRITVPAGVADAQVIKLGGQGAPGSNGGPNGDLYIMFSVANNSQFKRVGNDLYTTKEIDLFTAVLGEEVLIPAMSGSIKLNVMPGTQSGTKVRLKGKGFPVYKKEGEFGNLYVTYSVTIPTNLTDKQKELFNELAAISKKD